MRRGRLTAIFASAMLLLVALPSVAAADTNEIDAATSIAARTPITISLPITTVETPGRNAQNGQNGILTIRVGRSAPIRVIVDTGVTGLVMFPGAWDHAPTGVRIGKKQSSIIAPDGSRIPGILGSAPVTFGGARTVTSIPFLQVTKSQPYLQAWERQGVHGLLGIGTKGGDAMVNPITALPGELGLRWSLHFQRDAAGEASRPGRLVLGAIPPTDSVMSFPMPYLGKDSNGANLWNDHATNACWKFGTMRDMCVPTKFDSGFTVLRAKGAAYNRLPVDPRGTLRSGTRVQLSAPGAGFVGNSFVAGNQESRNYIRVIPSGATKVITSNSLYFDFTITYNVATGHLYLSNPIRKVDAR